LGEGLEGESPLIETKYLHAFALRRHGINRRFNRPLKAGDSSVMLKQQRPMM